MASSTFNFNAVGQKRHLSLTLCKYPSTLNLFSFHYSSHLSFSPPEHILKTRISPFFVVRAHTRHTPAKLSATDHEPSTKTINLRTSKETGSGFSLSRSRDERVVRKYVKNLVSSVVEETAQKRVAQDKYARTNPGFRKRTKFGSGPSGHSSLRSKDDNVAKKFRQTEGSLLVNEKMEEKVKTKRGGDNQVGEGKMRNRSKRNKVESPEIELKVGLDKCSKKGDVMGAIELYDKAMREGIDMGQYHYTVLLYLCSSAALGVVRPAKSGSGSRSSNALDMSSEVSSLNSMKLDEFRGVGNNGSVGSNDSNSNIRMMGDTGETHRYTDKIKLNSGNRFDDLASTSDEKENLIQFSNEGMKPNSQHFDRSNYVTRSYDDSSSMKDDSGHQKDHKIWVSEDVKKYAVQRGFEIYEKMCSDNIPMNEAALTSVARMAMSMGNGDLAFDMVKQMKPLGITPRLRSYGPALSAFCSSLDADKAFAVEKHMLEQGVYPEEPELEALLRASVGASKGDKVYYVLHKLRTTVRKVSPTTADLIVKWFESKADSSLGKTKWNQRLIKETIENKGGGWHGLGWLGEGNWIVSRSTVRADGLCECCGEKLVIIDLDPIETENFAESVASIAIKRDKNSSFQKFQKWLDYYGPFEAVVDAANVGLLSQKKFKPSKVNAVVNGVRQMLPSKKWPLVVLHNRHITGRKMDEPGNRAVFDKWKTADALYATPTGSNDDWYWLYAAIKFKCLLVTNDEMRDHTFQLLGNDFFPKWKERHQVHFSFSDAGPVFHMPPPCSVVIQESEKGHWHIPIASEHDYEAERTWLCVTRAKSILARQDSASRPEESPSFHINEGNPKSATQTEVKMKSQQLLSHGSHENAKYPAQEIYKNLRDILSASVLSNSMLILSDIEAAEKLGGCTIDFQI